MSIAAIDHVLIRLDADVIDQTDRAPMNALRHSGASRMVAFAYGTVPTVGPRLLSMSTYRWGSRRARR